jgi:hypothetical protein
MSATDCTSVRLTRRQQLPPLTHVWVHMQRYCSLLEQQLSSGLPQGELRSGVEPEGQLPLVVVGSTQVSFVPPPPPEPDTPPPPPATLPAAPPPPPVALPPVPPLVLPPDPPVPPVLVVPPVALPLEPPVLAPLEPPLAGWPALPPVDPPGFSEVDEQARAASASA